jgi:SulP family sulfate permease
MNESTQISLTTDRIDITKEMESHSQDMKEEVLYLPAGVEAYEIDGPFFFGVANKFDELMREIGKHPNIRIIRMRKVPFIDATGLNNLESLCLHSKKEKIHVILSGVRENIRESLYQSKIPQIVGEENICSDIHNAVERARVIDAELLKEQNLKHP